MEKVKVEENRVKILVNPLFYDFDSVKEVKNEFEQIGKVVVYNGKKEITVELVPKEKLKDEEMEIIGYEFYNHLLNAVKDARDE